MKRVLTFFGMTLLLGGILLVPNSALALPSAGDTPQSQQTGTANEPSGDTQSEDPLRDGVSEFQGLNSGLRTDGNLISFIANIIRWTLGLVGTVFFLIVLFNGFKYMTAGGDGKSTQDAVGGLTNAVVGLIIIMGAFLITNFVTSALLSGGGEGTGYEVTSQEYV